MIPLHGLMLLTHGAMASNTRIIQAREIRRVRARDLPFLTLEALEHLESGAFEQIQVKDPALPLRPHKDTHHLFLPLAPHALWPHGTPTLTSFQPTQQSLYGSTVASLVAEPCDTFQMQWARE